MSQLNGSFADALKKYSGRQFVTFKKDFIYERYTYGRIHDMALRFITLLEEKGVKKGDRIAICSYNCPQYIYAFIGSMFHGAVLVPFDFSSSPDLIMRFMDLTSCKLIITSKIKPLPGLESIYVEGLDEEVSKLKKGKVKKVGDDDLLEILFTSGTTGDPKGVLLTHGNIHFELGSVLQIIRIRESYRLLSLLPLSHIFEQMAGCFALLLAGAQVSQLKSRRPSEIIKVMRKERINCLATVPAFLILFKRKIEDKARAEGSYDKMQRALKIARRLPLPMRRMLFSKIHRSLGGNLKRIVCGGASLPPDVEVFWESIGVKVMQGYGMTETSAVLSIAKEDDRRLGAVGKGMPGIKIRISDDGEIQAKGPNLTKGYYRNPKATKDLYIGGWLRTGDIGEFDKDGHLFIRGRLKNMILKPSGLNVYPEDIEKVLDKYPKVKESCVLGIGKGTDVVITAVFLPAGDLTEDEASEIVEDANSKLEAHQQIQDHIIWRKPDFPRTFTLKVKRNVLLKEISDTSSPDERESSDAIINVLSQLSHIHPSRIKEDSRLYQDLGFDSLKVIELSTMIEEKTGVEIEEHLVDSTTTVGKLRELISKGKDDRDGIELNRKMFWPVLAPLRAAMFEIIFLFTSKFFTKLKVSGLENLESIDGQVIIAPNHTSHLDAPTILKLMPYRIKSRLATGAAADYFFVRKRWLSKKLFLSWIMTYLFNAYPMSRDATNIEKRTSIKKSLEFTGEIVDRGWSLFLFPEGTRTTTGKMSPFKNGIGIIIKETGFPVVPVKIKGAYDILPKGASFPRKKGPVEVIFGKPIRFDRELSPIEITRELEKKIETM